MAWEPVASSWLRGTRLDLYRRDGTYMIRVDGLELMNGFWHESEDLLGLLAAILAPAGEARILLGGLGLGHTLAALSSNLVGRGRVTVAELSPAVVDWYWRYLARTVLPCIPDNTEIIVADIADIVGTSGPFDVIVLDVDNGPEALVSPGNERLYSATGLGRLHDALNPGGTVLLWSAFESSAFAALARAAGFFIDALPVAHAARPELRHYLYLLRRDLPVDAMLLAPFIPARVRPPFP